MVQNLDLNLDLNQGFLVNEAAVQPLQGTVSRADGETVHLEPKVLDVLLILAENANRTVSRSELLDAVWRGQAAADELLTRAVSELRRALNDHPRNPSYIRTVPKRGYVLIGRVAAMAPVRPADEQSAHTETRPTRVLTLRLPLFGALGVLAVAIGYFAISGLAPSTSANPETSDDARRPTAAGRSLPLTSMEGSEWGPALSPDGRYAAFVSSPPGQFKVGNIFVVEVGSAMPVPLTTDLDVGNRAPTWSPDGTRIAFARLLEHGTADIMIKPVLGSFETKLTSVDKFRGHDWSMDGDRLAVAVGNREGKASRVVLVSVLDGSRSPFTEPPAGSSDVEPRYSPDGRMIAFARELDDGSGGNLCVKTVATGSLRCLAPAGQSWRIRDFDWSPDGESLIASVGGLVRVPLSGGPIEALPFGDEAFNLATAPRGQRLVYERYTQDSNLWRIPGPTATGPGEPERIVASTRAESSPRFSPDGAALAFVSGRSGAPEVWVADAAGGSPRRLTEWGSAAYPDWSPDGRMITFSSGRYSVGRGEQEPSGLGFEPDEAFLVEASGGVPRLISDGESGAKAPSWSPDGQYVFFTRGSDACGSQELWRRQLDSGEESRLTGCASHPKPGIDGRVYYFDNKANSISSVTMGGDELRQEVLVGDGCYWLNAAWTVWRRNLVYVSCGDLSIRMLDLETRETVELATPLAIGQPFDGLSLDVSPDGQWIVYSRLDRAQSDLILVDSFQ